MLTDLFSYQEHCDMEFVGALSTLNMNLNFLIAILVVLAVILTAVIVMAMYRWILSDKSQRLINFIF